MSFVLICESVAVDGENTERPSGVEGEGDRRGASRRASASFGEPMGPVWGGAETHRTLSAHRCGATALCSKTRGSAVEEIGGVPYPTVVDDGPSAARPSGETGRLAAPERRCVILLSPIRLLSWMDRLHRIGRRASPSVGEATGLVTQKLSADGRGPCYTYTDDGNLATRTWARGVTTSYTYDAWGSLASTTSSDGTPVATRPLYWQPRT